MTPDDLRRAFEARAQRVDPAPDGLRSIQTRIQRQAHLKRRITMGFASASSAVAVTVTAAIVGMASCSPPPSANPEPPGGGTIVSTAPPTPTAPTTPATPVTLPIYYLGEAGNRTVLYREFRSVPVSRTTLAGRLEAAVSQMLRDDTLDPDYFSAWPSGATVRSVSVEGGIAVVDLGGAATNDVGAEVSAMSLEQLVWTVTAVAADADSSVDGVRLLIDGRADPDLWGHVRADGVLRRGAAVNVQAPVWLISPQQGETVGRSFRVHIDGTVWEANAHLTIRNSAGTAVLDRFVMLPNGAPQRGDAFVDVTLTPGRYTVEAFYYSSQDGSVQAMDDHEITVA